MTHYYSRESTTQKGQFTIMEVIPGKAERLVCRTPRGDVAAHLVTSLNQKPLPIITAKKKVKIGSKLRWRGDMYDYLVVSSGKSMMLVGGSNNEVFNWPDYQSLPKLQKLVDDGICEITD